MKKSFILLHTAVLLAGFTGILGRLISINEVFLTWFRVFFSGILLYGILKITQRFKSYRREEVIKIGISGMLPGLFWLFFYASIKYSNVSVAVVCFCLTGFFTAVLNPLLNRRSFSLAELLLSSLTVAGICLIFHFDASYRAGILLGIVSSLFGSLYTLVNEKLVREYDNAMINYYQLTGASLGIGLLLPVYAHIFPSQPMLPTAMDIFYLFLLSLFCTIGLYMLVAEALKKISAFTVNLSFNLEPVYSIVLAVLIFKENKALNGAFYIGLFLILLSVLFQMLLVAARNRGSA